MSNYDQVLKEGIEEFGKEFKCINADRFGCDSKGSIPFQVGEDQWEAEQCQYCFEVLFKHKSFLISHSEKVRQAVVEDISGLRKDL
jgi:hypothetical protein